MIGQLEKRNGLIVGGVLLIAFSALLVTSLRSPVAYDSFWHLQMGKDWLENGLSPWIDHYSFTYNGHEIINPPVFFQALLHLVVDQFGLREGFQIVRFGFFMLTLGTSVFLLRQMKVPAIFYAVVIPMILLLLQMRAMVRPELFSYTLSVVALMLYFGAGTRLSLRYMISMVVLMGVWSNYHSSVVGYVIFFGFFLDCALAQYESKAPTVVWGKWFAWGLLIVAVGFLNHSFTHPLWQAITFPSEWKIHINEYHSPVPFLKSIAGTFVLILVAALTPILALRQRQFGTLVIWAVLLFSAVTMERMVAPSGIVIVLLTTSLIVTSYQAYHPKSTDRTFWNNTVGLGLLISIGVTLYSNVERARHFMQENQALINRYPVAMVDYMSEKRMSGRIFNNYSLGGYLTYRLSPQNQVYIDGRTYILYPLDFLTWAKDIQTTESPDILRAELDKYAVDQIMWRFNQAKHDLVLATGGFGLDFVDAGYALYTREDSNFPLFGKLMANPECWHAGMLKELVAERLKMGEIHLSDAGLLSFADFAIGYSNAESGKDFLDASIGDGEWSDEMRRFAGFRLLEFGYYNLVPLLLGGVETRKSKDHLGSAYAMSKAGDTETATQIMGEFSNIQWPRLQTGDVLVQYKLHKLLEEQNAPSNLDRERLEVLRGELLEAGYSLSDLNAELNTNAFCQTPENHIDKSF